jgi:hypothetical protein
MLKLVTDLIAIPVFGCMSIMSKHDLNVHWRICLWLGNLDPHMTYELVNIKITNDLFVYMPHVYRCFCSVIAWNIILWTNEIWQQNTLYYLPLGHISFTPISPLWVQALATRPLYLVPLPPPHHRPWGHRCGTLFFPLSFDEKGEATTAGVGGVVRQDP